MATQRFDVVVLGAGSAGERCGVLLARRGRSVAVVEEALVGGVCPYLACIPSKALLRPAHLKAEASAVPGIGEIVVDAVPLLVWRDELVHGLDDTHRVERLDKEGITLVRGRGRLDGPLRVVVDTGLKAPLAGDAGRVSTEGVDAVLEATEAVIVATGAEAVRPPIDGLDAVEYLTSDELTVLAEVPDRLTMVGGGIIGCELAQAFAALGCEVTLIHEADRVLDTHEPAAGRLVGAALEGMGVEVLLGEPVNRVRQDGDEVVVELPSGTRHRAGLLAIAVGRRPRLHGIGLETAGIDPDAPEIDASFRTPSGVFIAGDASAEGMYTHMANAQADVVVAALVGDGRTSIDDAVAGARSPSVVFTAPQVSTVGIRSSDAPEGSVSVEVDLARTAAAATMGRDVGGAMVGVFAADGTMIGATFVGPTAGEMLHAATIAVANRLTVDQLALAIPPFPTLSGIWDVLITQIRERLAGD